MILLDLSQLTIGTVLTSKKPLDEKLVRHMILNTIRSYRKKFSDFGGEMIICADGMHPWRRDVFPYYKAARRKAREASELDWNELFALTNKIRDEIAEFLPYVLIHVENVEADDVIGTICKHYGSFTSKENPILIISSDKDFGQLQKYVNVSQFNPMTAQFIHVTNPEQMLREHILYGDKGDGVPNFLSEDDCFVANRRQKPIPSAKVVEWSLCDPEQFTPHQRAGFERNRKLIDLECIPDDVSQKILSTYWSLHSKPIDDTRLAAFREYLVGHELNYLLQRIGEFT